MAKGTGTHVRTTARLDTTTKLEEDIRRLRLWNLRLTVALATFVLAVGVGFLVSLVLTNTSRLLCEKSEDGGIRLSGLDGPYVVTHIVALPSHAVVALPESLGWVASGNYIIPLARLRKLEWLGVSGKEPINFPENSTWQALYVRPEYAHK